MYKAFFECYKVVAVTKKSKNKKDKKKKMKGEKGNEEEGKKSPLDGISDSAGIMVTSFHLGSQCD